MELYNQIFDRQLRIEDWKQEKIKEQVVLILGVGGIGSIVLINLLRLGIKKISIIDYDVVDIHNINRQLIYSAADIGKRKVDAAKHNSNFFNVGNTDVLEYHFDAVKNWDKVVEIAKTSHSIFNCIDHGDHWDAAVQSLCISLKIPHLIAGSFAQSFMAEIYFSQPCYCCLDDMLKPDVTAMIKPDLIQQITSLEFLPKNSKPTGQSHIALCSTAGNFVTQLFLNYVNGLENTLQTKKILFYMTTFESVSFPLQANITCILCGDLKTQGLTQEQVKDQQESTNQIEPKIESENVAAI